MTLRKAGADDNLPGVPMSEWLKEKNAKAGNDKMLANLDEGDLLIHIGGRTQEAAMFINGAWEPIPLDQAITNAKSKIQKGT